MVTIAIYIKCMSLKKKYFRGELPHTYIIWLKMDIELLFFSSWDYKKDESKKMPIVVDKSDTKVHINSPLNHIPIDHALNINHLASKIF